MKLDQSKYYLFIMLCFANFTFAQTTGTTSGFKFGFKGGLNFSKLYTNNVEESNVLTGFHIGIFSKLPINDVFSLQPELLYTTKGSQLKYNNIFVNGTATFRLNYIEVPILLNVNLTQNFNIHFGPYIAFLVDGKVKNNAPGNLFDIENNVNMDDFNKFEAGLALGLGFDTKHLGFGFRYNYGLTKVGKERDFAGTKYIFPDAQNSVINLYLTYSIL